MKPKNLYFSVGGLEVLNNIIAGTNQMNDHLSSHKYEHLKYLYHIHPNTTHHSQIERSFDYILSLED
jgi:hypothetical protein